MIARPFKSIYFAVTIALLSSCVHPGNPPPKYYQLRTADQAAGIDLAAPIRKDSVNLELLEWAIFRETNTQRRRLGLESFKFDARLRRAAILHTREMVELDYFDHVSPIPKNETIAQRFRQVGIKYGMGGENLAMHPANKRQQIVFEQLDPNATAPKYHWRNAGISYTYEQFAEELVNRWLTSPPHRRNILNRNFRFLGVGCVRSKKKQSEVFYITQNFSSTNY